MSTYLGKICDIHPDLGGERDRTTRLCLECYREKRRAQRAKTRAKQVVQNRENRIRYGFENGDALIVLRNVAIECAQARGENGSAHWIRHVRVASKIVESYRIRLAPDAPPLDPKSVEVVVRTYANYDHNPEVPRETDDQGE